MSPGARTKGFGDRRWFFLPVVAALAGNVRSLRGDFVWDDGLFVERSLSASQRLPDLLLGSGTGLGEYFRPLCSLLGSLIVIVAGADQPWVWHLVNIAIHATTAAGVFQLVRRWGAPDEHASVGATLFALWPTGVDAVSWVSACTELLMGFFVVWGIVLHLRARDRGSVAIGASILHLGALLSKEVGAVFLPLAVAATLLAPSPAGLRPRFLRLFVPHLAVLAVYSLLRAEAVGPGSSLMALASDRLRPEALGPALFAFGWYVRECLLLGSGSPYVESPAVSAVTWGFAVAGLFVSARALDVSRRPGGRSFGLAGIWFIVALAPPLAFAAAPISITPVAVRYLYLPSIALCAVIALALPRVAAVLASPRVRVLAASAILALLLACGWNRQSPWLSDLALWTRAAEDNPHSSIVSLNLGLAEIVAGERIAGEEHLRKAAWNPALADGPTRQSMLVRVGEYYMQTRRPERAQEAFSLAATMHGSPATAARARASAVSLELLLAARREDGSIHLSREEAKRQLAVLENATALDPRDTSSRLVLALLEEALDEPVRALARYEEIARVSVARPERRAAALASAARLREVVANESDPVRRRYYQGQAHDLRGETDEAIRAFRDVLVADPNRPEVLFALAALLSRADRGVEAIDALEDATQLVPRDPSAWYNLGAEKQKRADFVGAANSFGRAIELAPDWWKPYLPRGLALESAGNPVGAAETYEVFLARFEEPSDVRAQVAQRLQKISAPPRR